MEEPSCESLSARHDRSDVCLLKVSTYSVFSSYYNMNPISLEYLPETAVAFAVGVFAVTSRCHHLIQEQLGIIHLELKLHNGIQHSQDHTTS